MDIRYPYAEPLSRLQLLYRLPTAPCPRRLLMVPGADPGGDIGAGWGDGEVTRTDVDGLLQRAERTRDAFDAVALPDTLRPCAASPSNGEVLAAAARVLVPGGIVVGHLVHALAMRRLLRPSAIADWIASTLDNDAISGPGACRRMLVDAGFEAGECYYVHPRIDAPMGLISSDRRAARHHFLRSVRSAWRVTRRGTRELQWVLAWLGLAGVLQGEIFFWARKPC